MSFSQSSALKCASAVFAAAILGCGPSDGVKEFSEGKEAYDLRDLRKAERLFTESLALAPQDMDRLLYLARTELELGELDKAKVFELDGVSVDAWDSEGYWANVRMYNTEPLVRLNLEGRTREIMESKRDEFLAIIRS